jgi:hypothetical protein
MYNIGMDDIDMLFAIGHWPSLDATLPLRDGRTLPSRPQAAWPDNTFPGRRAFHGP